MGPLKGLKIVEFGGIGPGPFCAQMLADMGADIIRIERKGAPGAATAAKYNIWHRSRRSIDLDLKKPEGIAAALQLIETADALIEGFRPGVMERLGLGPLNVAPLPTCSWPLGLRALRAVFISPGPCAAKPRPRLSGSPAAETPKPGTSP